VLNVTTTAGIVIGQWVRLFMADPPDGSLMYELQGRMMGVPGPMMGEGMMAQGPGEAAAGQQEKAVGCCCVRLTWPSSFSFCGCCCRQHAVTPALVACL
jgi:hypothetical protein